MEVVDKATVVKTVEAAVERFPHRRNPQHDRACVYTSVSGKSHCIAGQAFKDLGMKVPPKEVGCGLADLGVCYPFEYGGLSERFTDDAWNYLCKAQYVFDGGLILTKDGKRIKGGEPRKWRQALSLLREHEETLSDLG